MNVGQLIRELSRYPADTPVALSVRHKEADEFSVEESDDGWVVLEE